MSYNVTVFSNDVKHCNGETNIMHNANRIAAKCYQIMPQKSV